MITTIDDFSQVVPEAIDPIKLLINLAYREKGHLNNPEPLKNSLRHIISVKTDFTFKKKQALKT